MSCYIAMVGSVYRGFNLFGPCKTEAAAEEVIARVRKKHSWCSEGWAFELNTGIEGSTDGIVELDPSGTAVVFGGGIVGDLEYGQGFLFYGPYTDVETAYRCWPFGEGHLGSDCVVPLRPVDGAS